MHLACSRCCFCMRYTPCTEQRSPCREVSDAQPYIDLQRAATSAVHFRPSYDSQSYTHRTNLHLPSSSCHAAASVSAAAAAASCCCSCCSLSPPCSAAQHPCSSCCSVTSPPSESRLLLQAGDCISSRIVRRHGSSTALRCAGLAESAGSSSCAAFTADSSAAMLPSLAATASRQVTAAANSVRQ
jgi:hypothetical protein